MCRPIRSSPATRRKVVKARFDAGTMRRLLAMAWWDWPVDKITRNLDAIRGADIAAGGSGLTQDEAATQADRHLSRGRGSSSAACLR